MKINYFIDRIKINKLKDYNHIVVNGWAVCEDGQIPKYNIVINNEEKEYELVTVPRRDVCKRYKFDDKSLQSGFRIF